MLGVTAYLVALGLGAAVGTIWAFGIAGQFTATTTVVAVTWIGPDFAANPLTGALLLAIVGAVVGSLVHAGHLFSRRVGRHTFESSYVVWYLLRPLLSALLGMAFVAVVRGGLANLGPQGVDSSTPVLSFAAGALAGLFLDTVLQKLRAILGATAVDTKATGQVPPE